MEPTQGMLSDALDKVFAQAKQLGWKVAFKSYALANEFDYRIPVWAKSQISKRVNGQIEWADPDFLRLQRAYVKLLGARYDGNPQLRWVEIPLVGAYQEAPYENKATDRIDTCLALLQPYVDFFPRTQLIHPFAGWKELTWAIWTTYSKIGWRHDGYGRSGIYDRIAKLTWTKIAAARQRAPVLGEFTDADATTRAGMVESYKVAQRTGVSFLRDNSGTAAFPVEHRTMLDYTAANPPVWTV
jgi:hypothetical protein